MWSRALRFCEQRFTLVVVLVAVVQAAVLAWLRPGVLSIDEVTYLGMARSAAHGDPLGVIAFDLGAAPELGSPLVHEVAGRFVPQYPAGYALLAAPFYLVLGSRGLFLMSTLCFFGTVLVTRRLAARVLGSARLAFLSAVLLALGTFAWEYGAGLWPHALTMLLVTSAVLAAWNERALVAGLLTGLAVTVRLDAMFLVPALLALPAVRKGAAATWREPLPLLAGLVPGIVFLAVTNHFKFGTWMPFTYGPWHPGRSNTGAAAYSGLAVAGLLGLVLVQLVAMRPARATRGRLLALALVGIGLALALPPLRARVLTLGDGLLQLLVDLRFRELDALEPALHRSPRGAMIYVGAVKTSLAQSLPYLALLGVSLASARSVPARLRARLAVLAPFAVYLVVFAAFRWHGGLAVNLRYFVPVLPLVAIVAADGLASLARRATSTMHPLRSADVLVLGSLGILLVALAAWQLPTARIAVAEVAFLDVPLGVAAVLLVLVLASRLVAPRWRGRVAAAGYAVAVLAMVMAGVTELAYDAVAVFRVRAAGHRVAERAGAQIPRGSLVMVDVPDRAALLVEDDDALATLSSDTPGGPARLVTRAACAGRRSFAVLRPDTLARLRNDPRLVVGPGRAPDDGVVVAELLTLTTPCGP